MQAPLLSMRARCRTSVHLIIQKHARLMGIMRGHHNVTAALGRRCQGGRLAWRGGLYSHVQCWVNGLGRRRMQFLLCLSESFVVTNKSPRLRKSQQIS